MTLDLESPAGTEIAGKLAAQADIVVESFAPGRLESLGLGYEEIESANPRVVLTSISHFGQSGPYRDFEAEDITHYAMSGAMMSTGDPDREPLGPGIPICQLSAGMKAYIGSLMAHLRSVSSGRGDWVDVSIQEAALDNIEIALAEYLHLGRVAKRTGDEHPLVPWRTYPCRDGHAAIIGGPIRHWLRAAQMFDSPDLTEEKYDHMAKRIAHRGEIARLMDKWLRSHDKRDVYHEGQRRGLAFSYLASLADAFESPQLRARGYFEDEEHPQAGEYRIASAPFRPERTPWVQRRAPLLGEHTGAVLSDWLGARSPELSGLKRRGGLG